MKHLETQNHSNKVSEELNIPIGHLRHVFRKETRKELTMGITIRDTPYNYRGRKHV